MAKKKRESSRAASALAVPVEAQKEWFGRLKDLYEIGQKLTAAREEKSEIEGRVEEIEQQLENAKDELRETKATIERCQSELE